MSARRNLAWLGLTPEPEQELPSAVAALRASTTDSPRPTALAAAERRHVERLVLRGTQRGWLRYLGEVTELVVAVAEGPRPADPGPALLAGEVVLDHHRMLIGLPGSGYERTAAQRRALERALTRLRSRPDPASATPSSPSPSSPSELSDSTAEHGSAA
ncbi:hypothetical protein [Streptomyces sp. NPDC086787]|uniref:hypothetical protein n=1 Tax=Streptomyces sp. NPDC086787 TaxID=3365759 RepID=UPI0038000933